MLEGVTALTDVVSGSGVGELDAGWREDPSTPAAAEPRVVVTGEFVAEIASNAIEVETAVADAVEE